MLDLLAVMLAWAIVGGALAVRLVQARYYTTSTKGWLLIAALGPTVWAVVLLALACVAASDISRRL